MVRERVLSRMQQRMQFLLPDVDEQSWIADGPDDMDFARGDGPAVCQRVAQVVDVRDGDGDAGAADDEERGLEVGHGLGRAVGAFNDGAHGDVGAGAGLFGVGAALDPVTETPREAVEGAQGEAAGVELGAAAV